MKNNNENHTSNEPPKECLYQITSINLSKNDLRLHTKEHLEHVFALLNDLGFVDTITQELTDEGDWIPLQDKSNKATEQNLNTGGQQ